MNEADFQTATLERIGQPMGSATLAWLADRGVVSVTGADAAKLLQGIISNDLDLLDTQPAIFAGLLSPQGKVLFDFLLARTAGGYLLETARAQTAGLAKRLMMYRLRADVRIEDVSKDHATAAVWGGRFEPSPGSAIVHFSDPRSDALGLRMISAVDLRASIGGPDVVVVDGAQYNAHRVGLGIPEGGKDYDFGDAFPHEANLDLLGGVSFEKGCYVGQEIVARMEHRATVRKRVVRVSGAGDLPAGRPDIVVGEVVIGRMGSVAGNQGLALLRLDRAIAAIDKGEAIMADGTVLDIDKLAVDRHRTALARKAQQ